MRCDLFSPNIIPALHTGGKIIFELLWAMIVRKSLNFDNFRIIFPVFSSRKWRSMGKSP